MDDPIPVDLPFILFDNGSLNPCQGFTQTEHHGRVRREPTKDEPVKAPVIDHEPRLVSKNISLIVRKKDGLCAACNKSKRLQQKRKAEFTYLLHARNPALSQREMSEKLEVFKRQKRNAEKREAYWKGKFEEECVEVGW